jgi:hypothetical protein
MFSSFRSVEKLWGNLERKKEKVKEKVVEKHRVFRIHVAFK